MGNLAALGNLVTYRPVDEAAHVLRDRGYSMHVLVEDGSAPTVGPGWHGLRANVEVRGGSVVRVINLG